MSLPGICSIGELERLIGLSRAQIGRLVEAGIIQKQDGARGKYLLFPSVSGYCDYARAGRGGLSPDADPDTLDPAQERAKLDQTRRLILEEQIRKNRRETLEAAEAYAVGAQWIRIVTTGLATLVDTLERDGGLKPDQVVGLQSIVDGWRNGLAETLENWRAGNVDGL